MADGGQEIKKQQENNSNNINGAELGIETKKVKFWLKLSKAFLTSRAFIAILSAGLGIGGAELKYNFEKRNPLEERYMCKPDITIKAEQGKYVNICGCDVKVEDIIKKNEKGQNKSIVELTCKDKNEGEE